MPKRKTHTPLTKRLDVTAESKEADITIAILPIPAVNKLTIIKARAAAMTVTAEILELAKDLVVSTTDQYHTADDILHKIKVAQKRAGEPFEEAIRPTQQGLAGLYAIRREVENPLIDLEVVVKEKMRVYKIEEHKRLQAERLEQERLQREEQRRLDKAEEEHQRLASAMVSSAGAVAITFDNVESTVVAIPTAPVSQPVRAASSSARAIKRWRVTDFGLLVHAVDLGMVPEDILLIESNFVNQQLRIDSTVIDEWPGMETYDDFQIAGR